MPTSESGRDRMPAWITGTLLPLAMVSVLTFLLVGSSHEFSDYSPVTVPAAILYLAAMAAGAVLGWVSEAGRGMVVRMALVVLVPGVVQAVAYVNLPLAAGLPVMKELLRLVALQRLLAYAFLMAMLVLAGTGLGLLLRSRLAPHG